MIKKVLILSIATTLFMAGILGTTSIVDANSLERNPNQPVSHEVSEDLDEFTRQVLEWEAQGIDANHNVVREKMMAAIKASSDNQYFASMHIDREQRILGTLVFSFTQEPSEKLKDKLMSLKDELAEIEIRVVKYTQEQLYAKQDEVHRKWDQLAEEGIKITFVSSDIINDAVEIGIYPYEETHAKRLKELFGEMIRVAEQPPATTLDMQMSGMATADMAEVTVLEQEPLKIKQNVFQRLWSWVTSLFGLR